MESFISEKNTVWKTMPLLFLRPASYITPMVFSPTITISEYETYISLPSDGTYWYILVQESPPSKLAFTVPCLLLEVWFGFEKSNIVSPVDSSFPYVIILPWHPFTGSTRDVFRDGRNVFPPSSLMASYLKYAPSLLFPSLVLKISLPSRSSATVDSLAYSY